MFKHMVGATTDGPEASLFEQGVQAKTWLAVSNVVRKNLCEESEKSVCDAWILTLLSFEKMTAVIECVSPRNFALQISYEVQP